MMSPQSNRSAVVNPAADPADPIRRVLPIAVILLMVMLIATEVAGFLFTSRQQMALLELRNDTRQMRIVQQAVVDEKEAVEEYLISPTSMHLQTFGLAAKATDEAAQQSLQRLDQLVPGARGMSAAETMKSLKGVWRTSIALAQQGQATEAAKLLQSEDAKRLLTRLRDRVARYLDTQNARGDIYEGRIEIGNMLVLGLQVFGGLLTILFFILAFKMSSSEARARRAAMQQVETLFEMADMLQSAQGYDDANAVLASTARRLLPHLTGSFYIFNNSRDRLDLMTSWNESAPVAPPANISPASCWALKRGKPHWNSGSADALHCEHHTGEREVLEVPMTARGEVFGLLMFSAAGAGARRQLDQGSSVISALSDAMSLALSNIALREKLRNQALRDPLTGLYNRRYMEDMLQRFVSLADRTETPIAVIMIDLDHFKRLNDEHGHLFGDTVLKSVASTISGALRESDVACRYGGEELTVLLPDCGLADALAKAELLRTRIAALSDTHGVRITASLGVASVPDTSTSVRDLLSMSDAALYEAKRNGRDRVEVAKAAVDQKVVALAAE